MKIDFHCHTKATKQGEELTRNVSSDVFKEKVLEAEVSILCITNHNDFDFKQYANLRDEVKDYCEVWPGIEVDVLGKKGKDGHIIVVCNPTEAEDFSNRWNKIIGDISPDDFKISIEDLVSSMDGLEALFIAHYFKSKDMSIEDIDYLESLVDHKTRVFKEPSDLTSIGVFNSHGHRTLIGSDVKDWNNYEKCTFSELKLFVKGFENFLKLVDKDIVFIKDYIENEFHENITVYGISETKEHQFNIPVYRNVNIIFGDKGSGKSEVLKSLKSEYDSKGVPHVYFEGGNKDGWFKELLKVNPVDYNINEQFENVPNIELKSITGFSDKELVPLKNYRNYYSDEITNKNQKRMKSSTISKIHLFDDSLYSKLTKEYSQIIDFKKKIVDFEVLKNNESLHGEMIRIFETLKESAYLMMESEWKVQYSNKLFDNFVEKIAQYIAESTGKSTRPVETGFGSFAKNRIKLMNNIKQISEFLNLEKNVEPHFIGTIGDKGDGYINERLFFINQSNKNITTILNANMMINTGISVMRNVITYLERLTNKIFSNDLMESIQALREFFSEKNIIDMSSFMAVEKIFLVNGKQYHPSKGEKAILALQYQLMSKKDKQVFIIDEPELSLGSKYIEANIVPLINDLASSRKTLIIATHDGNIAVRTRPLNSILKIVDNDIYKTYIGSLFTNQLVNIDNPDDILSWRQQSVEYLEGGLEAFEERGYLYE